MAATADASLDPEKKEDEVDDEEQGGLDDDGDDMLTLKSGGQDPKTFEISKQHAELSKFVTTFWKAILRRHRLRSVRFQRRRYRMLSIT